MSDTTWAKKLSTVTLFVEDLAATREFYLEVFGMPVIFEDDVSAVFRFGNVQVNLLEVSRAPELVEPATPGGRDSGPRFLMTLDVDDVDSVCARLRESGVELLNGPVDRPWGVRTATFRDPAGHAWEIAR